MFNKRIPKIKILMGVLKKIHIQYKLSRTTNEILNSWATATNIFFTIGSLNLLYQQSDDKILYVNIIYTVKWKCKNMIILNPRLPRLQLIFLALREK